MKAKAKAKVKRKRLERDAIGNLSIPSNALYGINTERVKQLKVSGTKMQKRFLKSYALLKKANAAANMQLKKLDRKVGNAIIKACNEIIADKHEKEFVVGAFQPGAGTAFHMNLNEVIANRANKILKSKKVNPHDHVNLYQSTNDTFHTALRMAAVHAIEHDLLLSLKEYEKTLNRKVKEFKKIKKTGRTHLRYAVPLSLGEEFSGFSIKNNINSIKAASDSLKNLPLGGGVVGKGLTSSSKFASIALKEINSSKKIDFKIAENIFSEMQNLTREVALSSSLKTLSIKFIKTCNDLRSLYSDDVSEIILHNVMPGSSIMAGKFNPSVPELLEGICFQVLGNDAAISAAAVQGNLEINVFMPIVAYNLLNSIELLTNGTRVFTKKCLSGVKPNKEGIKFHLEINPMIATALIPKLGYDKTAEIVKEAVKKRKSVRDIVLKKKLMSKKDLSKILS